GGEAGRYRVLVEAEVEESLLRRDIERARGASATAAPRPATAPAVLVAGSPPEAVTALARAIGVVGFKAETPPLGAADDARAREVAARTGAAGAALVSANVSGDGPVRGTGKVAASCRVAVRILPGGGGHAAD